jgi:integrase
MHNLEILNQLKYAISGNDIRQIFKNTKFPNKNGSDFFSDKILAFENPEGKYYCVIRLKNDFEIAFRIIIYLKLSGFMGSKPLNSGTRHWINTLQSILLFITKTDPSIKYIRDINSNHIDLYIEKKSKSILAQTVKKPVQYLKDWITFANQYLPYFLRLDEELILNSKHFKDLEKRTLIERSKENLIENSRKSYSLPLLKNIFSHAMRYIDDYSDELIDIAKHYVNNKNIHYEKRIYINYAYLKSRKFENIFINNLKNEFSEKNNKIQLSKDINIFAKEINSTFIDEIEALEASCMYMILFLTGMRIGEFTALKRFPEIIEGEHYNLKRLVYKTSITEDGEELIMPIPEIAKRAIEILSNISDIKDKGINERIGTTSIKLKKISSIRSERVRTIIRLFAKKIGIKDNIDPHQLRHAMAFLIVHLNEKDGLELARMFLGHKSITMTLQYMGHYNKELNDAIKELTKEESEIFVGKITDQIKNNKKLFGENGKRLMPNHKFVGQQASDFIVLLKKGLLKLIEDQKLAIIQTPISLCMHDLSKPEELACQRGFDFNSVVLNGPVPSKCKGASCSNSLFFEEHIEKLKKEMYGNIDPELKARLEKNTFFLEAGGFEQDPFKRIVKEYDEYKEKEKISG